MYSIISHFLFCSASGNNEVNTILNSEGNLRTSTAYLITLISFVAMLALPIGKPPLLIGGLLSIPLLTIMTYKNRKMQVESKDSIAPALLCVVVQSVLFCGVLWAFNRFSDEVMPILGIIAASAVPRLLCKGSNKIKESQISYHPSFNSYRCISAIGLVWITPGYSASCISTAFFKAGKERAITSKALESAVEGYVLRLMLTNEASGKSPLGDIVNTHLLNFGSYQPPSWFNIGIALCVLVSGLVALYIPRWFRNAKATREAQAAVLVCQAAITTGGWLILFLGAGYLAHLVNTKLCPNEDYENLSILTPMLF